MAIIGSVFALVGRAAGRLVNTTLGWATILLFGRVEGARQTVLSLIALGSIAWVAAVAGVIVPDVGALLLVAVPVPDFIDETWVRLALLAVALLLPLAIGAAALFLVPGADRPRGAGLLVALLRGYPFALVLALTMVLLAAVATIRWALALVRRWETAHVPLVIQPGGYETVIERLDDALERAGVEVHQEPAPAVLALPAHLLGLAAGSGIGALVPRRLAELRGPEVSILVYPSDVAISGTKTIVARSRAAIATQLVDAPAYLTTSASTQAIEDELRQLRDSGGLPLEVLRGRFELVDRKLATLTVGFDEWETVYRERLQLERTLTIDERPDRQADSTADRAPARPAEIALGLGLVALVVVDLVAALADTLRSRLR